MTFFEKRPKRYAEFVSNIICDAYVVCLLRLAHRAWVNESAVKPFTFESLIGGKSNSNFDRKLFGSNPGYRQAVIEGARLLLARPDHVSDAKGTVAAVLEMIRKYEPVSGWMECFCYCCAGWPNAHGIFRYLMQDFPGPGGGSGQLCSVCAGSTMSGELRVCCSADREGGRCGGRKRIHYHCLEHNCPLVDVEKRWFCVDCGKVRSSCVE
jgi:hypothetical protein